MKLNDLITVDKEIQSGTPVFKNTRVPVQSLFWHIESGITIDEFIEDFPSVTKQQAIQVLELSCKLLSAPQLYSYYENFA